MGKKDSTQPTDILNELRTFIAGATRTAKYNDLELAKTALSLLKTLPAVREAVLEYFFTVFDTSVKKYVTQIENGHLMNAPVQNQQDEDMVISEIYSVIGSFVTSNPEAWAPIITSWSLKLLGEVSSRYSHLFTTVTLHETLQMWMSCKATRTLVDITTQCLSCLIDSDSESCISALLDTSIAHSPNFDWVVAHVGNSYPHTVITRVLSCGLKDFCSSNMVDNKLNSVVGVLGHLASSQFVNIRTALLNLFQWSLDESKVDKQLKVAVVPYLLQLVSRSLTLHKAFLTDVLTTLKPDVLVKLSEQAPMWLRYFKDDQQQMEDLVVHLLLNSDRSGAHIVNLLLEGTDHDNQDIALTSQVLMELLLGEVDIQLRSTRTCIIPFVESLKCDVELIRYLLLSDNKYHSEVACRLFKAISTTSLSASIDATCYLLVRGTREHHVVTLCQLISMYSCKNILSLAVGQALSVVFTPFNLHQDSSVEPEHLWNNLAHLLRYEASNKIPGLSHNMVTTSIRDNLVSISDFMSSGYPLSTYHCVATTLHLLPEATLNGLSVQIMLRLARCYVRYFIKCVSISDRWEKTVWCRRASEMLSRLCRYSSPARSFTLRELLDMSLFQSGSVMFGAATTTTHTCNSSDTEYLLMEQNHRLGVNNLWNHRESTGFGYNLNRQTNRQKNEISQELAEENVNILLSALRMCCGKEPQEPMIQISLLLVELISPDVMYNGLPWPEEDFCKVTIERDLHIRRIFDEYPLSWRLLELVSHYQPALCYSSILLRALSATLISQWSCTSTSYNCNLVKTTVKLLGIMSVGQLLPKPLSSLHEIVPVVSNTEVVSALRECVWNYMRDNVPAPSLFTRHPRYDIMWREPGLSKPSQQYTDTLRIILQNNMQHFGQLYSRLFVHSTS